MQRGDSNMLKNPQGMLEQTFGESNGTIRTLTAAEIDAVSGGLRSPTVPDSPIQFPSPPSPTFPPIEE
jgi:hypothetical protein